MEIINSFLTKNPCFNRNEKQEVQTITIQTVNGPQPSAQVFKHNWDRETAMVCPHAVIDCFSGDVYQMLPWDTKGIYYMEKVPENTIIVMLCMPFNAKTTKGVVDLFGDTTIAKEQISRVYNSAVALCAQLCDEYNLAPADAFRINPRRNPEKAWAHLDNAPTLAQFIADVSAVMEQNNVEAPMPEPVKQYVQIDVENLRIRTGPGREYETTGKFTGVGRFEIISCQNGSGSTKGWAQLASGEGWVSLDYATLV